MTIDICIVKYTPNDIDINYFNKTIDYFSNTKIDGIKFNLLIYDNNIENIGLIKARNILLSKAKSDYVCICDFDIEITNIEWKDIIEKFEITNKLGILAPVTRGFSTVNDKVRWQPKEYLSCNFMMFKHSFFDVIGNFDERFFVTFGDWDIIKRCIDSGYIILQDNKSIIKHFGLSRLNPDKRIIWRKDSNAYLKKHKSSLNRKLR